MKGKEEIINLVDDTIHWLKILCLEDIEKDIQDKRAAIEIEHYYDSILFSVTHTEDIVRKLNTLREDIAKEIREQKMQDKLEEKNKKRAKEIISRASEKYSGLEFSIEEEE